MTPRAIVLLAASAVCAAAAALVAVQPDAVVPGDIRMWGTIAFAALGSGLGLLGGTSVGRRTEAGR